VSYGIGHTNTAIAPWRLLFIVLGAFTVVWAAVLFFLLPDGLLAGNFLDERERFVAIDRIKKYDRG
jgi:hypothetical protein